MASKLLPSRDAAAPANRDKWAEPGAQVQFFMLDQHYLQDIDRQPGPVYKRVVTNGMLKPLSLQQTRDFVERGLRAQNWNNCPAFDPQVFDIVHRFSAGLPQDISRICNQLLLQCYVEQNPLITAASAREIGQELSQKTPVSRAYIDATNHAETPAGDPLPEHPAEAAPDPEPDPAPRRCPPTEASQLPDREPSDAPEGRCTKAVFTSQSPSRSRESAKRGRW